jgi:hypothetical protein
VAGGGGFAIGLPFGTFTTVFVTVEGALEGAVREEGGKRRRESDEGKRWVVREDKGEGQFIRDEGKGKVREWRGRINNEVRGKRGGGSKVRGRVRKPSLDALNSCQCIEMKAEGIKC